MTIDTSSSATKGRLISLFILGAMSFGFSIQLLATIWTSKSSLMPVKGTISSCDLYVTTVVAHKNRYGYEAKSQKAELIFYLNEFRKRFALSENIGSEYRHEEYEDIRTKLRHAESVTIWIKSSEADYWQPKVFQIESNRGMILDFQRVRFKERPLSAFLLIFGLSCMGFPIYCFYPKLFSKERGYKERLPTTSASSNSGLTA